MCNNRNSVFIQLGNMKPFRVDSYMKNIIYALNQHGIETLACCCGHGKYPMTIIYKSSKQYQTGNIYEFVTGWGILRKRRFYQVDKKGYYYIPEVMNHAN